MKRVLLLSILLGLFTSCKQGSVDSSSEPVAAVNTDSINTALLQDVKSEPKVKDASITEAKVLYVAVENDGTNRSGYASYLCETVKEHKADINTVKVVEFGTMNSANKDNAYGVLLGESTCN